MARRKLVVEDDPTPKKNHARKHVIYIPPSEKQIEQYAGQVCQKLAERDPRYNSLDVRYGLADFLKLVAEIHSRHLNNPNDAEIYPSDKQ